MKIKRKIPPPPPPPPNKGMTATDTILEPMLNKCLEILRNEGYIPEQDEEERRNRIMKAIRDAGR